MGLLDDLNQEAERERELAEALERERLEEEERKSQDLFERLRKTLFKPVFRCGTALWGRGHSLWLLDNLSLGRSESGDEPALRP